MEPVRKIIECPQRRSQLAVSFVAVMIATGLVGCDRIHPTGSATFALENPCGGGAPGGGAPGEDGKEDCNKLGAPSGGYCDFPPAEPGEKDGCEEEYTCFPISKEYADCFNETGSCLPNEEVKNKLCTSDTPCKKLENHKCLTDKGEPPNKDNGETGHCKPAP
jgi:hypothetical protein